MKLPVVFLEAVGQRQCRRSASTESIHDELGPQEEGEGGRTMQRY